MPLRPASWWSLVRTTIVAAALTGTAPLASPASDGFFLKDGERVIFFGDSITQNGRYIDYLEAFVRTRFPDRRIDWINHGISSETVSGTTERDHDPPRPHALRRVERDLVAWRPDVVVACFGMNDGNYHPFEMERFRRYQVGHDRLRRIVVEEIGARLVRLTPPPFDAYRRRTGDPEATEFGYRFPAVDYDLTLERYSRWVLQDRQPGVLAVDLHGPMNEHLHRRRLERVSFHLSPDAVHPNATGHWLMAQQVLLAWNAPAAADRALVDATRGAVLDGRIRELDVQPGEISFVWESKLPMPMDPAWDARSVAMEQVARRLNDYRLFVLGASASRYRMIVNGTAVGEFSAEDLSRGVDLLAVEGWPTTTAAGRVLELVHERRQIVYRAWRESIAAGNSGLESVRLPRAMAIEEELRDLCRPRNLTVRLVAAKDEQPAPSSRADAAIPPRDMQETNR